MAGYRTRGGMLQEPHSRQAHHRIVLLGGRREQVFVVDALSFVASSFLSSCCGGGWWWCFDQIALKSFGGTEGKHVLAGTVDPNSLPTFGLSDVKAVAKSRPNCSSSCILCCCNKDDRGEDDESSLVPMSLVPSNILVIDPNAMDLYQWHTRHICCSSLKMCHNFPLFESCFSSPAGTHSCFSIVYQCLKLLIRRYYLLGPCKLKRLCVLVAVL